MTKPCLALLLPLVLAACATASPTAQSWSCRPAGNQTCAPIHDIDAQASPSPSSGRHKLVFGARPADWWRAPAPGATTREDAPRREGDQTMRIVLAPYLDAAGDYHDRSTVFAVMRKGQWWIAPPVSTSAAPEPGTELPPAAAAGTP